MNLNPFDFYRFDNPDGSSKLWALRYNHDGTFTTFWGKSGAKMASNTKGIVHPDDMHKLIRSKQRKGYEHSGQAWIGDDGKISNVPPTSSKPVGVDHQPTENDPHIYWRIKIPSPMLDSPAHHFSKGLATGYATAILRTYPDCLWAEMIIHGHGDFVKPDAGCLSKEDGIASLLLLMVLKKNAPEGITVSLSHEDGVEISDQLKLETEALSFFDTDLESIRQIAEEMDLLVKRIDLTMIAPEQEDFYF